MKNAKYNLISHTLSLFWHFALTVDLGAQVQV